jgi:Leucine-rich repeat (LRR) protein
MEKDFTIFWSSLDRLWQANINHGLGNEYSLRGKVPSSFDELATIKQIDVHDKPSNLEPLLYLPNLLHLNMPAAQIDYTFLSQISTLRSLKLANSTIEDLTFLVPLQNLTELKISLTKVIDLSPLAELKKLRCLDISQTHIPDWSPLVRCKKLSELHAYQCGHFDIDAVAQMHGLKILNMKNNVVPDFAFLSGLAKLEILWFENGVRGVFTPACESGDYSILKTLPNLVQISCSPDEFDLIKFWFPRTMYFDVKGKELVTHEQQVYSLVEYLAAQNQSRGI